MRGRRSFLFFLALAGASLTIAHSDKSDSSDSSDISWSSPRSGDSFSTGSTLTARWTSEKKVVSPSFKLCDDSGCGEAVWPDVSESDGAYSASVSIPDSMTQSSYHLQMKDDFGNTIDSSHFDIGVTPDNATHTQEPVDVASQSTSVADATASQTDGRPQPPAPVADTPSAQAPLVAPSPRPSKTSSFPTQSSANDLSQPPSTPRPLAQIIPNPQMSPFPQSSGSLRVSPPAATRSSPPVAAIAVPLSLAGTILLVAGLMAVHHRRQLVTEQARGEANLRQTDTTRLFEAISRRATTFSAEPSPIDLKSSAHIPQTSAVDLEKALLINALLAERQRAPTFPSAYEYRPYIATSIDIPRQSRQRTRDAYLASQPITPLSASPPYTSSATTPFPPCMTAVPVASNAIIPSSLRAAKGSGSEQNCAPLPSDASITGDFLPSYLPSPDSASKSLPLPPSPRFENIPLSPRIPPALHVRSTGPLELDKTASGESVASTCQCGTPPRSSLASEQRTLYDAVARALGAR